MEPFEPFIRGLQDAAPDAAKTGRDGARKRENPGINRMGKMQKPESAAAATGPRSPSLITDQKLMLLYAGLLKRRMIEKRAQSQTNKRKSPLDRDARARLEAVITGVAMSLLPDDTVVSGGHLALPDWCNRASMDQRTMPLQAKKATTRPAPALGTTALLAAGAAMAHKAHANGRVVAAFLRGRIAPSGAWREAMSAAGFYKLPVLFVRYGSRETASWRRLEAAFGFPHMVVDGSDVVAIYRVACEATAHARKGNGPTLIECRMHPSSHPIRTMEKYLEDKGLMRKDLKAEIVSRIRKEMDAASGAKERS